MAARGPPPEIKNKPIALALEDYDAENHREISFHKDDKIYLTFYSPLTSWWKGWCNGDTGYFPKDSVKPLVDVEQMVDVEASKKTVRSVDSQDKKRRQLILSIVSTEEQYVKDMQMIPDVILRDLQGLMSATETQDVFRNIETICQESKSNLTLFNRKAKTEEPVGDVFLRMATLYENEVIPWAEAQCAVVCQMERLNFSNPEFQQCAEAISEKLGGLTIYEWFAKPVRRALECFSIAKMLLLKTPQDNGDFKDLTDAIEVLGRVKEALKAPAEEMENRLRIVAIQSALQGQESLVTPTRKLIREWTVQEVRGKKASERKATLLTDMLVVVKVKKSGLGQGSVFPLNRITLAAVADTSASLRYCFEITCSIGPKKEKRRFSASNAGERDAILNTVGMQTNAHSQSSSNNAGLVRESSNTILGSQNSSESVPKKGIFQKLRSTRTLSIGGEDGPPAGLADGPSTPASSTPPSQSTPPGGAQLGGAFAASMTANSASRPTLTTRSSSSAVAAASKSPRVAPGRESSPRVAAADGGKSPRSWATASTPSAGDDGSAAPAVSPAAASGSGSLRESSAETTTQLARGSSVVCSACGEAVVGSALNSKGRFFHSHCYKCHECSKSLLGIPFAEKKGEIFCRECALALFAEPCSGCGKMITGQFLSAFGEKYHPACFVCAGGCGTNVSRGYAKRDGKAYCRSCAKERP